MKMVVLNIKRANEGQFLYQTTVHSRLEDIIYDVVAIYNGRLKVHRICYEVEDMAKHGVFLPPQMQGLSDEQLTDLKLNDEWAEHYLTSENYVLCKDPQGRRNGKSPLPHIADILLKTVGEVKAKISKKLIESNICLTQTDVGDALEILKGAVSIAYPMGLPVYEPVKKELENEEDLTGTQASLNVIPKDTAELWWAGKELERDKKLHDYIGKNEKTKLTVKLQKVGQGPPAREPILSEEEHKRLMLLEYRKREELKRLEEANDDSYMNSAWADNKALKKSFQGIKNIKWVAR